MGFGQAAGDGARWGGKRWPGSLQGITSTRSLWQRLFNFSALLVLGPFKIFSSSVRSTALFLSMFPFSDLSTGKSFLAAQNKIWGDSFLIKEWLSPKQMQSWLLSPPSTSCVTWGKEIKTQSSCLAYGYNFPLKVVVRVQQDEACPAHDGYSLLLLFPS